MSSAHSPTISSLHLRHSSFSNPSVASPTPQFILLPSFRFSYVTSSSLNSPGDLPMSLTTLVYCKKYNYTFYKASPHFQEILSRLISSFTHVTHSFSCTMLDSQQRTTVTYYNNLIYRYSNLFLEHYGTFQSSIYFLHLSNSV